ncbi:MAG: VanZ family protein [Lachnospiraceae bacterium]|nr:VanZ family protein [Lachnospiraceae bacterium]
MIFGLYIIILLYATLFGNRSGSYYSDMTIGDYIARSVNLVPFKTISLYIKWIFDGNRYNNYIPLTNLGVNLILLFPMGFFLPNLFGLLRNFIGYLSTNILILALIETIQLITRRGSFDVDDFILNIIGAIIGYLVWLLTIKIIASTKKKSHKRNNE